MMMSKKTWITFNGEIYNYLELKDELTKSGITFNTSSDTEVILKLYLKEKNIKNFLNKLNGIFAFAIWDSRKKSLLLARDNFGIKPLHFYHDGKNLLFGSEIKSILASNMVSAKLNTQALHDSMNLRYIPGNQTLFKNIHRLDPGTYLEFQNGKIKTTKYYDLKEKITSSKTVHSEEDAISGLQEHFEQSIQRQIISDVPLGVYLSGGLDSSSITYFNRKFRPNDNIPSFTLQFNSEVDEVPDAEIMANFCKTNHHVLPVEIDPIKRMKELIWHLEEPKINALQGYLLAEQVKQHVKVVHGGLGGDELLAGYKYHEFMNLLGHFYKYLPLKSLGHLTRPLSNLIYHTQNLIKPLHFDEYRRGVEMTLAGDPVASYLIPRNVWDFNSNNLTKIYNTNLDHKSLEPVARHFRPLFKENSGGLLSNVLWAEFHTKMINDLLLNDDRVSMAHGVELRVPLLDKDLVEFAFNIPANLKMKKNNTKHLMKSAMEPMLPREIIHKPKAGFQFSSYQQFQAGLKNEFERTLTRERINELGVFNYDYVRSILDAKPSPKLRWHYFLLWQMLGFDTWHKVFIEA